MRAVKDLLQGVNKRDLKRVLLAPRRISARLRALPDFIVIGAQRSATSSLYSYLVQHPQIYSATYREVHYFDLNYNKGKLWCRWQFPLVRWLKNGALTGEASTSYLYLPEVPPLLDCLLPDVKMIVYCFVTR